MMDFSPTVVARKGARKRGKGRVVGTWPRRQTRMIDALLAVTSAVTGVVRSARRGAQGAMAGAGSGYGGHGDLASELQGVSVMEDYELLSAIDELAVKIESDTNALARLIAGVAEDETLSAFVSVTAPDEAPATRPARFRVVDAGLNRGRTWGYGEVVYANEMGCAVTFTWIRPAPSRPKVVQSYDPLTAIRNEVLFRFAFLYGLRDAHNKPTVATTPVASV